MRRRGATPQAIKAVLLRDNATCCDPPLPKEEVRRIAQDSGRWSPGPGMERRPQAEKVVSLAEDADLFHTSEAEPYATILVGNHRETWPLKSKRFRSWLAARFFKVESRVPNSQAMHDALTVLEGRALHEGPEHPVHTRLAERDGVIYLDLADEAWRAVEIGPEGWRLLTEPPVKFRRPKGLLALPEPMSGSSLDELRRFVNVAEGPTWALLVGWLLGALRPRGPYPILFLHGEQGSAKSTTAHMLRALLDPSRAPLRPQPKDVRDLMIAATNNRVLVLDNISSFYPWFPDALCRLSTGGGYATRELYSNDSEVIFDAQCPVIVNGIEELATRPDLLDRAIVLHLPPISEEDRRPEEDLWKEFEVAAPRILGALLDAVSAAIRNLPSTQLERSPRMADFALWVTAAEEALGWVRGAFLKAYSLNREAQLNVALESSPVAEPILDLIVEKETWTGTAGELLELVRKRTANSLSERALPKTPAALSNSLRRLVPVLRSHGVRVTFCTRTKTRRGIVLERIGKSPSPVSPASPRPVGHGSFWGLDLRSGDARDDRVTRGRGRASPPTSPEGGIFRSGDGDDAEMSGLSKADKVEVAQGAPDDSPRSELLGGTERAQQANIDPSTTGRSKIPLRGSGTHSDSAPGEGPPEEAGR